MLYDSIIPCFGGRFAVSMMPAARRYRVFPLGTFHYFDWQRSDRVGISIGSCPQIISSETAHIGVRVGSVERILPFDEGDVFANLKQQITPLTTTIAAADPQLPVRAEFCFRSHFVPQSFESSGAPAYLLDITIVNDSPTPAEEVEVFFRLPLANARITPVGVLAEEKIVFPDGIDHRGVEGLIFEQLLAGNGDAAASLTPAPEMRRRLTLPPGSSIQVRFVHVGYIAQPTLNVRGDVRRFGYTTLWEDAAAVLRFVRSQEEVLLRKSRLFESTLLDAGIPPELKGILAAAFKGLAANAWWAEGGWFSVMEIGAYHSTLDVDYQSALFFFQYWPDLVRRMLVQWADYYAPGSGYMAHDVGQHLEATGNRYGGPGSAMKVEENCNYILLLHHYWRWTGDASILPDHLALLKELGQFLIDSDTDETGLPNRFCDNTNDWGSALITAAEEQSYHGVRMAAAFSALAQIARVMGDEAQAAICASRVRLINSALAKGWRGDHYPISLSDAATAHHYSMWTTHGLLYPLRTGMTLDIDLDRLCIDLISSTARTLREHGCIHSTADARGWLTQNLWRDCIAAYLGIDHTHLLRRYLGHGEYVSYEDTTILEVANELMIVGGAVADHTYAGQIHDHPLVDGHPRPACGFGLLYALAGVQADAVEGRLTFRPLLFPLKIALTHRADWEREHVVWLTFRRSIPNQDGGPLPSREWCEVEGDETLVADILPTAR
ncbi:MAG: DUF4965 domain-containing protein [Anaerolineae bacterium]|nr:DUF4965 domain-containing protein [Anaerolineae bacterium]NUQ03674.1 DUF4965 domain-containing protein [Anaerolineae bacterium]